MQTNVHSLVFSLEDQAWQEPQPSHVIGMALAHCILGKFLGVVCHCFPLPLDFTTLASRCILMYVMQNVHTFVICLCTIYGCLQL